jgi:RimJ/RimL family protein N-acetyltransferase
MMRQIAVTSRLILRELELSDAEFIKELVNDPDWLANIGQRNVHSIADAEGFIQKLRKSYDEYGFGFYVAVEQSSSQVVGLCGLIKRPELEHVDLGFAFLPAARGKGYAQESSLSIIEFAKKKGLKDLMGIVDPKNSSSSRVLEKIGMSFLKKSRVRENDIELLVYQMKI